VGLNVSKPFFKEQFPSTFDAMGDTLDRAMETLLRRNLVSNGDAACMRLCIEEALVNAIRHGNDCDERRKVSLEMGCAEDACTIRVRDEGGGFAPESVELPDPETLGGRGVCLMRHFMDEVTFDPAGHCLEMTFSCKAVCNGEERR